MRRMTIVEMEKTVAQQYPYTSQSSRKDQTFCILGFRVNSNIKA